NKCVAARVGTVLVAVCCGDHAAGVSGGSQTGSTSGGCTQHVFGLRRRRPGKIGAAVPRHDDPRPCPILIRSRSPGHSIWLAHPRRGCPVGACSGAGQTPIGTVPGGFGGRGNALSMTPRRRSSLEWPASAVHTSRGTGRKAMSPFPLPPSPDSADPPRVALMG